MFLSICNIHQENKSRKFWYYLFPMVDGWDFYCLISGGLEWLQMSTSYYICLVSFHVKDYVNQPLSFKCEIAIGKHTGGSVNSIDKSFWSFIRVIQKFCNILVRWGTVWEFRMLLLTSWKWRTTLDWEIPNSPDTLWLLLIGFADVVKVTNHTGLEDTKLAWYSLIATHWICRCRKSDESHWTGRYQARLILSDCYSLDLPMS